MDRSGPWDKIVEAGGRPYIVTAPSWSSWQDALDQALSADGPNPQLLLEECLRICLRTEEGSLLNRSELRELPARDGDLLLTEALALIDEQRDALNAKITRAGDGTLVRVGEANLRLRSWTFGERNEALRQSLRLRGGRVTQDLTVFERELLGCCVSVEGTGYADLAQWPVALGELVMRELDALNGLAAGEAEIMAACLRTGIEHPDLALIRLCRTFGLTPDQLQQMDARTGERLLAGLQLLEKPAPVPAAQTQASPRFEPGGEGVTRILVYDE